MKEDYNYYTWELVYNKLAKYIKINDLNLKLYTWNQIYEFIASNIKL